MRLLRQLFGVLVTLGILFGILLLFTYDIIKIDWPSFMEIQPAYKQMEDPLPVPALSIPVDGPAFIPNLGAPSNPVAADQASVARGAELYRINCAVCHGEEGKGDGPIAAFLTKTRPADLTGVVVTALSDRAVFTIISNGSPSGMMPPLNENLTVRERWDIVNYVRTLPK